MNDLISVFDLLAGDPQGYKEKQIHEQLFELKGRVKSNLDSGSLDRESFDAANSFYQAILVAEETLERLQQEVR